MRLRPGDILGVEALVEADRHVDALHDLGRSAREPAAPGSVLHAGRRRSAARVRMKSARIAIPLILVAVVGSVAAALALGPGKGPPHAGEMRKFTPLDAPRPAPDVTFSDADGRSTSLAAFRG